MNVKLKNRDFIVADFETSTEKWYKKEHYARVWLWGVYNPQTELFDYGTDLDSFMKKLINMDFGSKNPVVYFHNLKFDGSYILNWLFRNGYRFDEELEDSQTFRTCITDMGIWHFIEICIYKKGKQRVIIHIQDSLKKIPLSVREIPESFGFSDEMVKGEIDYDEIRPIGHLPTKEELSYVERDVKIVGKALKELIDEGFTKSTCASDSFNYWKNTLLTENAKNKKVNPNFNYRRIFPSLDMEVDDYIRRAYRGGWTYVNPIFQDKILEGVCVYDINSMYPSKMKDKYIPFGEPKFFKGKPKPTKYQCYICRVMISFEIKEGHLPTIQLKNSYFFNETEYIESSNGYEIEMTLTNIDLKLIFKQYNVKSIKYLDGYYFRKCRGLFNSFVDSLMEIKENSVGGRRFLAKRRMNSCYGKTATSPRRRKKIPVISNGVLGFVLSEEEVGEPEYTAIGIFVTSHARYDIICDAQANYDRFIYCDTDSLHLLSLDSPPNLPIHKSKLGYYKLEKEVKKAIFLRSKTYIEEDLEGNSEIKCAGASPEVKEKMGFDNFKIGATYEGKLMPRQVEGGCILMKTSFSIN